MKVVPIRMMLKVARHIRRLVILCRKCIHRTCRRQRTYMERMQINIITIHKHLLQALIQWQFTSHQALYISRTVCFHFIKKKNYIFWAKSSLFHAGVQPKVETHSRPDSPESGASSDSDQSDLSSPSFNRDSEFDFTHPPKAPNEAEPNRTTILAMAPIGGSFENESDSNSTATARTVLSQQAKDNTSLASLDGEKRIKVTPKPVSLATFLWRAFTCFFFVEKRKFSILWGNNRFVAKYQSYSQMKTSASCYIFFQISPISPNLSRQASGANILARTSSSGSASSGSPHPSLGSANSQRQSSQGSLFEQFATQAKELVRETKRQSSQDGLLAHVDKVNFLQSNWRDFLKSVLYHFPIGVVCVCATFSFSIRFHLI